ncbi:hypothetical protein HMPREF9131_1196 [Peptoniphilus sp. oral taxon 836 str. F0141]|nr:hypothetical protein HMPREF9131_1196 [Peptoniphilus sp. oral taxon 836 str. F0141]
MYYNKNKVKKAISIEPIVLVLYLKNLLNLFKNSFKCFISSCLFH